jgi:hypothetical protein
MMKVLEMRKIQGKEKPVMPALERHYVPKSFRDRLAFAFVRFIRIFADTFFARRYGHRAVVLETIVLRTASWVTWGKMRSTATPTRTCGHDGLTQSHARRRRLNHQQQAA